MAATDLYLIRKNQQWVKYTAVTALSVTGPATADEISVWSSEFRDTFSSAVSITPAGLGSVSGLNPSSLSGPYAIPTAVFTGGTTSTIAATSPISSDEVAHEALRQTALARTFWKFDIGAAATPRYLYAWVLEGDIIANNPPDTV